MSSTKSTQPPKSATGITNIVVFMLENRSYDNVLGRLYGAGNAASYDKAPADQCRRPRPVRFHGAFGTMAHGFA